MAARMRLAALRPLVRPSTVRPASLVSSLSETVCRALQGSLQQASLFARLFATHSALKAASSVAGQPGSKNLGEVKENAKQEVKKVTSDLAAAISGGNDPKPVGQVQGGSVEEIESSVNSLAGLAAHVPRQAWVAGAAGFLPYVGTSLSTIYLARQSYLAEKAGASSTIDLDTALALLHHVEQIQVSYGAIILSFLGAIHWGFEFAKFGGVKGTPRYLMGIVPVLIGWPTLLIPGAAGLAAQWAAFTGVWFMDSRATANGWTPKWYSTYRFALTAVVGSCILLTMGATNYYMTGGTGSAASKLAKVKKAPNARTVETDTEEPAGPRYKGTVEGEMSTHEGDEAYVVFENAEKKREEEENKKQEEEEEKKKEADETAKKAKDAALDKAREARDKAEGRA